MKLLTDGKNAFPEILRCMREARESIYINMFIWRNDTIGNQLAEELLYAAQRGIRVHIVKDRYGVILERCEENRKSFFHRKTTLTEQFRIAVLSLFYNRDKTHKPAETTSDPGTLLQALLTHPNVTIERDANRYDHSKFYVFDDRILIIGGINVEDKENGIDYAGRAYQDYMVEIDDPSVIREFWQQRSDPRSYPSALFEMNIKHPIRYFGIKDRYLSLIRDAKESLTIVMAYISPLPELEAAIVNAAMRGIDVRILIPANANFEDDLNKKAVSRLMRKSSGKVKVFLSDKMVHTKLLMNESLITLGSSNITRKAFNQLDELNLFLPRDTSAFTKLLEESVDDIFSAAHALNCSAQLSYHHFRAALESLFL
jgi:cardiolipin synthase